MSLCLLQFTGLKMLRLTHNIICLSRLIFYCTIIHDSFMCLDWRNLESCIYSVFDLHATFHVYCAEDKKWRRMKMDSYWPTWYNPFSWSRIREAKSCSTNKFVSNLSKLMRISSGKKMYLLFLTKIVNPFVSVFYSADCFSFLGYFLYFFS